MTTTTPPIRASDNRPNARNRETGADNRILDGTTFPTTYIALHHDIAGAKASKCECRLEAATLSFRQARSRRSLCNFLFLMFRASITIACPWSFITSLRSSTDSLAYMDQQRIRRVWEVSTFFLSSRSYNTNEFHPGLYKARILIIIVAELANLSGISGRHRSKSYGPHRLFP